MSKKVKEEILFQDKDVIITKNYVEIKCYYFPIATSKVIPFSQIQQIQFGDLTPLGGQGRLWGMDLGRWGYWFAGDLKRFSRDHYIAIHRGSSIKPSFTPQKAREVYQLIYKLWKRSKKENNQEEKETTEIKMQQVYE